MTDGPVVGVILAAGLGDRLRPLTAHTPKSLLPVLNRSLADWIADSLEEAGATTIAANAYHLADKVRAWAFARAAPIAVVHEAQLTGPAGGLSAAMRALPSSYRALIAVSGDAYTTTCFRSLLEAHDTSGAPLTVVAKEVPDARRFGRLTLDGQQRVRAVAEKVDHGSNIVSCGIYVLRPELARQLGALSKNERSFDFGRHLMPHLAQSGQPAFAHVIRDEWSDVGTPASLLQVNMDALHSERLLHVALPCPTADGDVWCQGCHAPLDGVNVTGRVLVGRGATVERGAALSDGVVLGANVTVASGSRLCQSVVLPGVQLGVRDAASVVLDGR